MNKNYKAGDKFIVKFRSCSKDLTHIAASTCTREGICSGHEAVITSVDVYNSCTYVYYKLEMSKLNDRRMVDSKDFEAGESLTAYYTCIQQQHSSIYKTLRDIIHTAHRGSSIDV